MTGSYRLLLKKSAERELRKIPKADLQRITERIKKLAAIPRAFRQRETGRAGLLSHPTR